MNIGTCRSLATGAAAVPSIELVGPRIISTLSTVAIRFVSVTAWPLSLPSSASIMRMRPQSVPAAFASSKAVTMPLRIGTPTKA